MTQPTLSDLTGLVRDARQAIYTLQAEGRLAEDTRRNVEGFLHRFEDMKAEADRAVAETALAAAEQSDTSIRLEKAMRDAKTPPALKGDRATRLKIAVKRFDLTAGTKRVLRAREEYTGFFEYLQKGVAPEHGGALAFRPDIAEAKTLRTDSQERGGYLVPQIVDSEIRKNITEISPVRLYARQRVAAGKTMDIPRRLAILQATFEGEAQPASVDVSTYGSEQVTLYRQAVTVPATLDMQIGSPFDLEREISADVGEAYASGEGRAFLRGDGNRGPQGVLADPRIEVVDTAAAGTLTFDDVANLIGKLKRGQNPMLTFSRNTLSHLWQIKSSIGVPIWQPAAGGGPAAVWGEPYDASFIDLDDAQNGAGAKPIVFGDWRRGYEIFDLVGISVIRDDITKKAEAITEWTFRRYLTGRVIVPEAFKVLRIKA